MDYVCNDFIPKGWQCPVCRRVYSPGTSMCMFCGGDIVTTTNADQRTISWPAQTTGTKAEPQKLEPLINLFKD